VTPDSTPWAILVSGSRDLRREHYTLVRQQLTPYSKIRGGVLIHGDGDGRNGSVGADQLARHAGEALGFTCYGFPADWDRFQKRAGPIRNRLCVEVLFAFAHAGYRLGFLAFPTGGPGTAGAIQLVEESRDTRGIGVHIEKFQVSL
jgi:hypothetical protein